MRSRLDAAAAAVRRGRPVAYPTDTLWGLGVSPRDRAAVARLYRLKERPGGMPVSVAVSSLEELEPLVRLTAPARVLLRRTLPGPYTFLLPASAAARRAFAPSVLGAGGTLGVRVPDHPVARRLLARTGPLTTTSANRHGEPPVRSVAEARRAFGGRVGAYVGGGPSPAGRPSTLVSLLGRSPRLVHRG